MVVRLANQVSRVGAGSATDVIFVMDSDEGEGMQSPQAEKEAKEELTALFSRKAPEGSQIANGF